MEKTPAWMGIALVAVVGMFAALLMAGHLNGRAEVHKAGDVVVLEAERPTAVAGYGGGRATVVILDGGCVGMSVGGRKSLVLWPTRTLVAGTDDDVVLTVEGRALAVGDSFAFDVDYDVDSLRQVGSFDHLRDDVPVECRDLPVLAVELV